MLTHLFKLIWNKKKQNFLLILEMLISFIVMFAVFTLIVYYYQNYKRPMGFDYEHVWVINYNNSGQSGNPDSVNLIYQALKQTLHSMPQIKEVSFASNNVPFSMSNNNSDASYGNVYTMTNNYTVEDDYPAVLNIKMQEGRWFSKEDDASKYPPVVINNTLKAKLFGTENPLGKIIGKAKDSNLVKVVGVIADMKDKSDFQAPENAMFRRINKSAFAWLKIILVKIGPEANAAFESRLYKTINNSIKNSNIEIEHLADKRVNKNKITLVPMTILLIVAGFLIINVALGLFGVLWYNINKRKSEIGLRRAVGASGSAVSYQLVGEALVLATISLIIGSFFAVQFPLLNVFDLAASTYLIALVLSIIFIYLLVIICALYPGRQAAAILPAVALHEE